MCEALVHLEKTSDADLRAAIERKLKKFGRLEDMPPATRILVHGGMLELGRREDALRVKRPSATATK